VLRVFLPVTRSRLKGLGCTIPFIHCSPGLLLFDTATPAVRRCQSFPLRGCFAISLPRLRDVPARHSFLSLSLSLSPPLSLYIPPLSLSRLLNAFPPLLLSHEIVFLSEIARKAYLYFTGVPPHRVRFFYASSTRPHRDILVLVGDKRMHISERKEFKSLFLSGSNLKIYYRAFVRLTSLVTSWGR